MREVHYGKKYYLKEMRLWQRRHWRLDAASTADIRSLRRQRSWNISPGEWKMWAVYLSRQSLKLAGVNMVLGASAAGARALTTSAGPGFSLKQEGISYLVAADLPAVIVDVMRIGTGLGDIAQGQGDYWQLTRGGGHGDYHTLVLAPASVQENADLMVEAFDLAEKYRHPVLIASDAANRADNRKLWKSPNSGTTTSTNLTGVSRAVKKAVSSVRSRMFITPIRIMRIT